MKKLSSPPISLAVLLVAGICSGCGRKQAPRLSVHPVSGRMLIDGQPPVGAEVYFHPRQPIAGLTTRPLAKVTADGTFQPGTYLEHDGLPVGRFVVTVVWPKVTIVEAEEVTGADQLGGRFSSPEYPVAEVTVSDGPIMIPPLELRTR